MIDNSETINDFLTNLGADGLSKNRILKYKTLLGIVSRHLNKRFQDCSKKDLIEFFSHIQTGEIRPDDKFKRKEYAENTKRDFKIVVKKFWRWLKDTEDNPIETKWINTTENGRLRRIIRTKDVLTEEEVYKMVDASIHTRDKAIISCLFESASRIGEIVGLKISDIVFDKNGYYFITNMGKTGEIYKRVMNPTAIDLMNQWIKEHPLKFDDDSPLWVTLSRANIGIKRMNYAGFNKMLKETATKVGITKKVTCHQFRHAKITDMRINKRIPDSIIEMLVGWRAGSDMFDTYQHGKSEDVDKALSKVYTITDEKTKQMKRGLTADLIRGILKLAEKDKELDKQLTEIVWSSIKKRGLEDMLNKRR